MWQRRLGRGHRNGRRRGRRAFLRLALAGAVSAASAAGCVRVRIHLGRKTAPPVPATVTVAQGVPIQPAVTPWAEEAASPTPLPAAPPGAWPPVATTLPERILAPKIGLNAPVVEVGWEWVREGGRLVSRWRTADYAAGFHKGSPLPGEVGNIVISGHHNIAGRVFERLYELAAGDRVSLVAGGVAYDYVVVERLLLREKGVPEYQQVLNASWIAPTRDARLTLVTCWPPTGNDYRVIVVARPTYSMDTTI